MADFFELPRRGARQVQWDYVQREGISAALARIPVIDQVGFLLDQIDWREQRPDKLPTSEG